MCNILSNWYLLKVINICLLQLYIYITNTLELPKYAVCWGRSPKFIRKSAESPPFTLYGGLSQILPQKSRSYPAYGIVGKNIDFWYFQCSCNNETYKQFNKCFWKWMLSFCVMLKNPCYSNNQRTAVLYII